MTTALLERRCRMSAGFLSSKNASSDSSTHLTSRAAMQDERRLPVVGQGVACRDLLDRAAREPLQATLHAGRVQLLYQPAGGVAPASKAGIHLLLYQPAGGVAPASKAGIHLLTSPLI